MENYHVKEDPTLNIWIEPPVRYQSTIKRAIRKLAQLKLRPLIQSSKAQKPRYNRRRSL